MLKLFDWFVIFIAIFVPPVSVYLKFGNKGKKKVAINFGLFVIGFIPALIHALYLISEDTLREVSKSKSEGNNRGGDIASDIRSDRVNDRYSFYGSITHSDDNSINASPGQRSLVQGRRSVNKYTPQGGTERVK